MKRLGVDPEYTLTDKDWSEINAMRIVWPSAKHQLCFWHALRALKQRLAKLAERPGAYNAEEAHKEFEFIDPTFVPVAQQTGTPIDPPPAIPLRRVRLLIGGRPPVPSPIQPRLTIRIPPRAALLVAASASDSHSENDPNMQEDFDLEQQIASVDSQNTVADSQIGDVASRSDDEGSDAGDYWAQRAERQLSGDQMLPELLDDWEYGDDEGWDDDAEEDLRTDLEVLARQQDYTPDSMASTLAQGYDDTPAKPDASEPTPPQPKRRKKKDDYAFCPAPHRLSLLRLFAKHASQHSLLPERHGQPRTKEQIREDAIREMYNHCHMNRLCEVWAYLWNNWYSKDKWHLWARSANANSIPVHRTTMIVESLWRNLKRLVLQMYNRPPVDLANYAIITQCLPIYRLTLSKIIATRSGSRPDKLTTMQAAFKRSWERLASVPIKGSYDTDLRTWTCNCGAQKYHSFILCKHLVQKASTPSPDWWVTATRYHIPPFYTVEIDGDPVNPPERKRDWDWLARMDVQARPSTPDPALAAQAEQVGTDRRDSSPVSCMRILSYWAILHLSLRSTLHQISLLLLDEMGY